MAFVALLVGIGFLVIGFLNHLFYDRSYIAGPAEMSISVCAR